MGGNCVDAGRRRPELHRERFGELGNAAIAVKSTSSPITTNSNAAGAACGDAGIDGALSRFAAALSEYTADLGLSSSTRRAPWPRVGRRT